MTLYYLGEMTTEEISRFLGVSTSAIKLRLHRARQRLQKEETMIREALSNFKLSPYLTDNIIEKVRHVKPTTPSGSKPFIPWVIGASSIALIVLMFGLGSQYLAYFQQPYSLDSQSELAMELIDTPIVLNLEAKLDVQNQLGKESDDPSKSSRNGDGQESNQVLSDKGNYTEWRLPENAKARLGKGTVSGMAYSPISSRLAVASSIGVWICDAHTGKELALLTGHANSVRAVTLSPDGVTVAGGLGENTIRIWDIRTGKQNVTLTGHSGDIRTLAYSPDGKTLASAGDEKIIRLWDPITGQLKQSLSDHGGAVYSIAFSLDGETIASGSWDHTVRLWNTETGKLKNTLVGHTEWIFSVAFSPDGKFLQVQVGITQFVCGTLSLDNTSSPYPITWDRTPQLPLVQTIVQ